MTNGLWVPKCENPQKDHWLELLKEYIIDKFIKGNQIEEDVRKIIGTDFNYDSIIGNSRTSQIRQMMHKHLVIEEAAKKKEEPEVEEFKSPEKEGEDF
jgi:hypothetical protein